MLFNSVPFVFIFLPVVLAGFFVLGRYCSRILAVAWAGGASLLFYGWPDPLSLVPLILVSITFNFFVGRALAHGGGGWVLFAGVAGNLLLLSYFKYASFLLETASLLTGLPLPRLEIALPIGISFYTFTQIAFLVDAYRREVREYEFLKYGLFVTYFPHLVAGPILHHKEIMPQFDLPETYTPRLHNIARGLSWFAIGLFKKVMLADSIAPFVDPAFKAAAAGAAVSLADAWVGVSCFALQIYFDFSGYSDMAIGLALMMGIHFPLNFNSPYKADSLIEFWRRWHMTLSRFLRDYLYIPLGGNRHGPVRRYTNLLITMLLGGLWHGASWNFVLWGAIHGVGLAVNHLAHELGARANIIVPRPIGRTCTLLVVLFAWVPFRADTLGASLTLWQGMLGFNGMGALTIPSPDQAIGWIAALALIALLAPNTQEILSSPAPGGSDTAPRWRPNATWAVALGCLFGIAAAAMIEKPTVFLYFRF
jgi:alginate O-acetyltransferase complex protein AlgI